MRQQYAFATILPLLFSVQTYGIEVSMPDVSVNLGSVVTVDISVDDATGIAGGDSAAGQDGAIPLAVDWALTGRAFSAGSLV